MENLLATLCICFFTITLSAQPNIQWQASIGGSNYDESYSIQQTSDGGYVIAGVTLSNNGDVSNNHGGNDFWIVKLSGAGAIQWQKTYGGSNHEWAYSIQQTSDGGYIVVGLTESNDKDVSGNHGDKDFWVVKLNNMGDILWQKTLGGSAWDEAASVQQTLDGGYIIAGRSNSLDGDVMGNHGGFDFWVIKLSNTGVIEWQKSLGGSLNDVAYSVKQTSDGGYIVAGGVNSDDGDVSGFHGSTDYWVVKLSNIGAIEWQKALGGTGLDNAADICQTSDGGYILVGAASANNGDVTGLHGLNDYWVIKLNNVGDIQWQKALGGSGEDWGQSIQELSDGGYIISGTTQSNNGDVMGNDGGQDYWLVKLDHKGELLWQKTLGGTQAEVGASIQQTNDHGFIVTGRSRSNDGDVSGNHGSSDFWIVKLSPESSPTSSPLSASLEIFPNPASSTISINPSSVSIEEEDERRLNVSITDFLGRALSRQSISNGEDVDIAALPNGFYLLTATTPSGKVFSGKFRKQE